MKINWKIRFKNKAWLLSFTACIIGFVYQVLGMLGVVPAVSEDQITNGVGALLNILVMLGVVVDPTTEGVEDSDRAMEYK